MGHTDADWDMGPGKKYLGTTFYGVFRVFMIEKDTSVKIDHGNWEKA